MASVLYTRYMMKKPLRLALALALLLLQPYSNSQAQGLRPSKGIKAFSAKEIRVALRQPSRGRPLVPAWNHHPIKLKGGSDEFKIQINKMLNEMRVKTPLFYKVALHRVDSINWAPNSGSFAFPNHYGKGTVYIGDREWNHPIRYGATLNALIHEIQHCNTFGDSNEGAARWSGYYYGQKLDMNPFVSNFAKGMALRINYNPKDWDNNLLNTRLNYKLQPKNDFNTMKYARNHAK